MEVEGSGDARGRTGIGSCEASQIVVGFLTFFLFALAVSQCEPLPTTSLQSFWIFFPQRVNSYESFNIHRATHTGTDLLWEPFLLK